MVKYNRKRDSVKKRKQSFTSLDIQLVESSREKVTDNLNEHSYSGQDKETNYEKKKSRFFFKGH